jgi:hypothetical protein
VDFRLVRRTFVELLVPAAPLPDRFGSRQIEKKDILKARGYAWSPGVSGRPKCWYRDVLDADKAEEVSWLRQKVMGPDHAVWALRITARDRYSDRCWCWGEPLAFAMDRAAGRSEGRWSSAMKADIVRAGQNDKLV